jgi:hypothetical protein
MSCKFIVISGYRTGGTEDAKTIRNSFAFDLTNVDLRDCDVVSAALPVMCGVGAAPTASILLSDPSARTPYGHAVNPSFSSAGVNWVPLTPDAIADLEQASGGFFSVDAVVEDLAGHPQRLSSARTPCVLRLNVVAALAERTAAA